MAGPSTDFDPEERHYQTSSFHRNKNAPFGPSQKDF